MRNDLISMMRRRRAAGQNCKANLVQRLTVVSPDGRLNPFSFGGGLSGGGLTYDAISYLPFHFDYMGAAEYEWGAVPDCLQTLATNASDLVQTSIKIPLESIQLTFYMRMVLKRSCEIACNQMQKVREEWAGNLAEDGQVTVYIICHEDFLSDTVADIKEMIDLCEAWGSNSRPKDPLLFENAIYSAKGEYKSKVRGWLALGRCFFFTIDHEMQQKTWEMFQGFVRETE